MRHDDARLRRDGCRQAMTRAVLFDLDDTLYDERRFILSGFSEVARAYSREYGVSHSAIFRVLVGALRSGHRADALQRVCAWLGRPEAEVATGVDLIRTHRPRLRLSASTARLLARLNQTWATGVVTNGLPEVQARKVEALGLAGLVDCVVYAEQHGSGRGKPERAPFDEALRRLGVPASRAVFVGNDPTCDICGGRGAGLWTIRLRGSACAPGPGATGEEADLVVRRLDEIPAAVETLVGPMPTVLRALASVPGLA